MSKPKEIKIFQDTDDLVYCRVCNVGMRVVHWKHLKRHGLTIREYQAKFPGAPMKAVQYYKNLTKGQKKYYQENPERRQLQAEHPGELEKREPPGKSEKRSVKA